MFIRKVVVGKLANESIKFKEKISKGAGKQARFGLGWTGPDWIWEGDG